MRCKSLPSPDHVEDTARGSGHNVLTVIQLTDILAQIGSSCLTHSNSISRLGIVVMAHLEKCRSFLEKVNNILNIYQSEMDILLASDTIL